ncbi:hypothetical protein HanHA300_Chr08g0290431 [Helianthus annuus]|nr:hypothetical protein HanHA300_Chr08g0290431 [Helianthus annuus]KAJ0554523.1 hypothetical protein HanHA89_Chr08g0308821 [Helianthus annuus]KAJ0720099.1 hypothetical protein HanLR1_Chr08g0289291 [Helianthus annuus]
MDDHIHPTTVAKKANFTCNNNSHPSYYSGGIELFDEHRKASVHLTQFAETSITTACMFSSSIESWIEDVNHQLGIVIQPNLPAIDFLGLMWYFCLV